MAHRTSAWALALLACACDREPAPPAATSATASAAPIARSASAHPPGPRPPADAELACRALRLSGAIRVVGSDRALKSGDPLDGRAWLELDPASKLWIRHTRTSRELSISGPARALPCVRGEEQVLLAKGAIETSQGPGARPGAEVLVATPLGTVRYSDATLRIQVDGRRLEVSSNAGKAFLDPIRGATLKGKAEVEPKSKTIVAGNPKPEALVEGCEASAAAAEKLAREVLSGKTDGGTLGSRAAAHVGARQQARGDCTIAATAVALAAEGKRGPLEARVAAADRRWKAIPRPPDGPQR